MNCEQAKILIEPYADGELEASAIVELESHLQRCPACASAMDNLRSLRKALKQDALYFSAPKELRQRIAAELPAPSSPVPARVGLSWNWLTTALSGLAVACLALLLIVVASRPSADRLLEGEMVSSHVRSMMADHALDVASSDQHTVKPWFNGKLDFSPPVKDLKAQEFPLIGGRLDYIGGRSVAALVFQRHKHVINLFVWSATGAESKPVVAATQQGFHIVRWSQGGMNFSAVSDLNEKELTEFAQLYSADTR